MRFHSGVFSPQVITLLETCVPIAEVMSNRTAPQAAAIIRELIIGERRAGFPFRRSSDPPSGRRPKLRLRKVARSSCGRAKTTGNLK